MEEKYVYVVQVYHDYCEGTAIAGIFDNEKQAIEAKKSIMEDDYFNKDSDNAVWIEKTMLNVIPKDGELAEKYITIIE